MQYNIYKYPVPPRKGPFSLSLPKSSEFLDFQLQDSELVLWFLIDVTQDLEKRDLRLRWTGDPFGEGEKEEQSYLASAQLGSLVFHLFERKHV